MLQRQVRVCRSRSYKEGMHFIRIRTFNKKLEGTIEAQLSDGTWCNNEFQGFGSPLGTWIFQRA
jgi:hypothetical protein